jgi:hypothetical protein
MPVCAGEIPELRPFHKSETACVRIEELDLSPAAQAARADLARAAEAARVAEAAEVVVASQVEEIAS